MGTRAQFFINDPQDKNKREWLGCVAWDGYPDGDIGEVLDWALSEEQFRERVAEIKQKRDDFCDPEKMDFPFPWKDDLFLTDCTYYWDDESNEVKFTYYHRGFVSLSEYRKGDEDFLDDYDNSDDILPSNISAPSDNNKPLGPDSIMILTQ